MEEDALSYEALADLLRTERRSNRLAKVPRRFWPKVRELLETLESRFREEQAQDPISRRVMQIMDEVKNARAAAEAMWALRERKLAIQALAQVDGSRPDGITSDEAQFYGRLHQLLQEARQTVFTGPATPTTTERTPSQENEPAPKPPPEEAPPQAPEEEPPADGPAGAEEPTDRPTADADGATEDDVTIRALDDIPPFVGPDMETYLLKEGDVATVPTSIANLLVKRRRATIVAEAETAM